MRKLVRVVVTVPILMDLEIESIDDPELPIFDIRGIHEIHPPSHRSICESFDSEGAIRVLEAFAKSNLIIGGKA